MPLPLLQTKLYIPSPRQQLVSRPAITAKLGADGLHPLTLIAAPAGFGKTTLVSEWIAQARRERGQPVAWLSLDEDDNDPARFLTYLIAALQTHQAQMGASARELLNTPQAPPPKVILTLLINELSILTTPLILVLDDYHVITAQPAHEALTFLIDHLPPQFHLILTSRIDPPLPLERWRVRNQLADVRADDLRFTPQESAMFLNNVMGLTLSPAEITTLERRTEGWIAGLQLAALSMQGRSDVAGFIQAFSGSNRHVLSYLVEEVLNHRPLDTLNFLLQTSILDRMCASLCDAITGETDGQVSLAKLEQANLFLIPLDDEGKWYRYHHLFAEALRTRLQQSQPEMIPQLHQRASEWYAAAGQIEPAVGHALSIPNVKQAATLVEGMALATVVQQGQVRLVRRLVERLPIAVVYGRPYLTLAYAFTLALSGQFEAVDALLLQAAPTLNTLTLPGDVAGGLAMLQSTLARFRGDLDQSLVLAQQALHMLPSDALALRAGAALNIGSVYFHRGNRLSARQALADAIAWSSAEGADYVVLVAWEELAADQAREGQLTQAKQSCEQALTDVTRRKNQHVPAAGLLQVSLGEVLVEWNELTQAIPVLRQGVQLLQGTTEMGLLARGYGALARAHWAGDAPEIAFATLREGEEWLTQIQTAAPGTYARLAACRARFQMWQGDLDAALRWEQTTHIQGETLVSYFQQLTRVRIRLAQYARHPQGSLLQEATAILAPLFASAEVNGWGSHLIEILLLQALIEQAQENRSSAQTALTRALTLAEPENYIRLFVDEGEAMQFLILDFRSSQDKLWISQQPQAEQNRKLLVYVDKVLAAFGNELSKADKTLSTEQPQIQNRSTEAHERPKSKIQNLIDPLSARELEVLQLVAAGLSNTQIATRLIVTTSTVKAHINHIFSKLAVESRIQAIVRAREHGLLSG